MNQEQSRQPSHIPIRKSEGVNESERSLINLCRNTFLDLWSFPNPYRKQGSELCDLLVVSDPHVIIFSDKTCIFNPDCEEQLAWKRWYKKAITASVNQLYGAERWIREHPTRIYLDARCTQQLPLPIPSPDEIRVHRIVVAGGAASACQAAMSGSGSLVLLDESTVPSSNDGLPPPFCISHFGNSGEFIHVVDEVALKIILQELDTISDLIPYLTKKERFIQSSQFGGAAGEENLLAYYLGNVNANGEHDFVFEKYSKSQIFLDDTHWRNLQQSPQFIDKKDADKESYIWDKIISIAGNYVTKNRMRSERPLTYEEQQIALRAMAREPRLQRRVYGSNIVDFLHKVPSNKSSTRTMRSTVRQDDGHNPEVGYVLHLSSIIAGESDEEYWKNRRAFLTDYCLVIANKNRDWPTIIGIATESGTHRAKRSYDFVYLDNSSLNEADYELAAQLQAECKIHLPERVVRNESTTSEYPEPQMELYSTRLAAQRRAALEHRKLAPNWPCPCGSRKKYKRCCG